MFGVGPQELLIVGLLALLLLGPGKLAGVARDLGGFVHKARASMEELRSDLGVDEAQGGTRQGREPERRELETGQRPGDAQGAGVVRKPGKGREGHQKPAKDREIEEKDRSPAPASLSEGGGEHVDSREGWST